jgi:hypothetical protein
MGKRILLCPFLHAEVELTDEREQHIAERHPDLLPAHAAKLGQVLADPDEVRRSDRFPSARLFSRWYDDLRLGKHVVVVIVSDAGPPARHWVITAYMARKLAEGRIEWQKS